MKKTIFYLFIVSFAFMNIAGCIPLIIGGAAGALGAYAISKDTIQGDSDKPYDSLWDSAIMAARSRGVIRQEDSARGYIELNVNASSVYIRMTRLTRSTVRVKVSAKKHHLPDLNLAQDLFVRIIDGA